MGPVWSTTGAAEAGWASPMTPAVAVMMTVAVQRSDLLM